MPGPPPKPPERRQRRNKPGLSVALPSRESSGTIILLKRQPPPAPENLLERTRKLWHWYWDSQVASVASDTTDLPQIEIVFQMLDEHARCFRAFSTKRLVRGSQGQMVLNPLGRYCDRLRGQILSYAREIGLTPIAKLRLGITAGHAKKTLDQMNRELDADDDAADPRRAKKPRAS